MSLRLCGPPRGLSQMFCPKTSIKWPTNDIAYVSNARRKRGKATRDITFRNCAADDVIATAWRTAKTWSQLITICNQKVDSGRPNANAIGSVLEPVEIRGKYNGG